MITLRRNRRKIYVCNTYFDPELKNIKKYSEPIELYENCQTTSGLADIERFGLESYQYMRIKTTNEHGVNYHYGDAVYVNVTPPQTHDPYCKTADYEVSEDPIVTLNFTEVLLKRRSGRR